MIEIDGSRGEGGGQILRSALALSMCTGQGFVLERIRAGRAKPGLMRQHLACVNAAAQISDAQVQGAELNSQAIRFVPGTVRAGEYSFQMGSAASCCLLLQTLWPALMLAPEPSRLRLTGGTHNPAAPPFHFLQRSYAPLMNRLGARAELALQRMGFYPAGGGSMTVELWPARLKPFDLLERGKLKVCHAECFAPALPRAVAQRELQALGAILGWEPGQLITGQARQNEGPGNALLATLEYAELTEVFTQFGLKGVSSEQVAQALADELQSYQASKAALGPHMADQWALPLALAVERTGLAASYTCTEITPHAQSNFEVIEKFLAVRFVVIDRDGGFEVSAEPL
ncbi:RNA 3'-terminal phosphate cyclase [Comamonas composti]|uniref:RNA 3'-terminal phosphate cyclase n=1 Tax=Comamonas composti TaxID=408558 RepID=UPI000429A8E2|nr:RNA 3'-terminal phosphate cyclase [Comamonas composti]